MASRKKLLKVCPVRPACLLSPVYTRIWILTIRFAFAPGYRAYTIGSSLARSDIAWCMCACVCVYILTLICVFAPPPEQILGDSGYAHLPFFLIFRAW